MNGPKICQVLLKALFHDLDPLNLVRDGNYLKYYDPARFSLFEKAGIDRFCLPG